MTLLPVPNLQNACLRELVLLSSWNKRHMSLWRFFEFSEWTALASRSVHDASKRGAMKNWAKRSRAGSRCSGATSKK